MSDSRRLRGIAGLALKWGVALSALATTTLVVGIVSGVVPDSIFGVREVVAVAIRGFAAGGVAGGLFAYLLSSRERSKTLQTLTSRRAALWGFIAAGCVPALMVLAASGPALPLVVIGAGVLAAGLGGSLFSVGLLRLARRPVKELAAPPNDDSRLIR